MMRRRLWIAIALLAMATRPTIAGGGRGGGQGGSAPDRDAQRHRLRTRPQEQRDRYRTCDRSLDRVRSEARDMARYTGGPTFFASYARFQRDQLREGIRTLQQEHEHLMQALSDKQKGAVQEHVRAVQQIQARINTLLQQMDQELGKDVPDSDRLAEQTRAIEQEVSQWQIQNRQMGEYLGLSLSLSKRNSALMHVLSSI
jgi:DNA repair exonuclease SbcCD ATPase subunit